MNILKNLIISSAVVVLLTSCDSFLDINPKGKLGDEQLNTADNIEKLVIAAYSLVGGDFRRTALWPYSDVRSDDAYKGGGGTGDNAQWNIFETFVQMRVDLSDVDLKWYRNYVAVSRANNALARLHNLSEEEFPKKQIRVAEMRFLRAHQMFELKLLFKHIPWIDETILAAEYINISNVEYTDKQLWDRLIEEFRFAVNNLPEQNEDVGRANKYSAKAYLAKVLLYAAYEQNEKHEVVSIDKTKLEEVVTLISELEGRYSLAPDFARNFLHEYENGTESVFAVQNSSNDGTPYGMLDQSSMLTYPMNAEYGCCGFLQPSQNLVNAFKTDENGLPLFESYNMSDISTSSDLFEYNIDLRLLHTVAIPGVPFKYNPTFIYERGWSRQPETYGAFLSMKGAVLPDCSCFQRAGAYMSSSKNRDIIRYDDALLWKAEALIELGRHMEALPIINSIRLRAQNSSGLLVDVTGNPTAQFKVGEYINGENCNWTQEFARKALRWERRLEMALECSRFFDLVRWGDADQYMNTYFSEEKTKRAHLRDAQFTKSRDEYFPIPLAQINFSKKLHKQNYGWPDN
ncbi:MAG: RagB/SusD family nutrient uptake outer membrane protein [Parabacteroides sp.]|nr:RagB/SusD family nutrient uptake outer membrane protein [Parabacteroides sp.]